MLAVSQANAQAQSPAGAPVTVDNFVRAETNMFFGLSVKDGALGKFLHRRAPMGVDDQFTVRGNRDTLYSVAVFDLDAGPVTVAMPDAGKRFMSLKLIPSSAACANPRGPVVEVADTAAGKAVNRRQT